MVYLPVVNTQKHEVHTLLIIKFFFMGNSFSCLIILQAKIRATMENAFWDGIIESMKQDDPDFDRVIQLLREVRVELCEMAPQSWKQEVTDAFDIEVLSQVIPLLQPVIDLLSKQSLRNINPSFLPS